MYNACVLRACGSQVPEPKWKHANYKGFIVKESSMEKGYDKIWNGDQCAHISNHDQVKTKEACKSICRRNYHCTAVSYSKIYKACVLRACGSQVPEPKWKHANYRGFIVKDIGKDKGYDKIWNGDQCPHISNHDQVGTPEACMNICRRNNRCTAVSYSIMYKACVLRACGSQVPEPKWKHANYKGFIVKDIAMDKGYDNIWNDDQCPYISDHNQVV